VLRSTLGRPLSHQNQVEGREAARPNLSAMTEKKLSIEPSQPNSNKILYRKSTFRGRTIVKCCKVWGSFTPKGVVEESPQSHGVRESRSIRTDDSVSNLALS